MIQNGQQLTPDCLGFSDESMFNDGRWRSIAVASVLYKESARIKSDLAEILTQSSLKEFKWNNLIDARCRFGANKIIDYIINECSCNNMRIDVLIWDTEDRRHKIAGRDDKENLQRMYYHIIGNVIGYRWNDQFHWDLFPDETMIVNWDTLQDCANFKTKKLAKTNNVSKLWPDMVKYEVTFRIKNIIPSLSHEEPLIQVADLFAGMAAYSRNRFDRYCCWKDMQMGIRSLFGDNSTLSKSDMERCGVIHRFVVMCKDMGMSVSIDKSQGLKTFNPKHPVNFWPYMPQHAGDVAPLRLVKNK